MILVTCFLHSLHVYTHNIYLLESPTIFTSHSHVCFLVQSYTFDEIFEGLIAALMNVLIFWDVTQCGLVCRKQTLWRSVPSPSGVLLCPDDGIFILSTFNLQNVKKTYYVFVRTACRSFFKYQGQHKDWGCVVQGLPNINWLT
jgi:hypothetical protein